MASSALRVMVLAMLVVAASTTAASLSPPLTRVPELAPRNHSPALRALSELNPIDAHVHFFKNDPAFQVLLTDLKLRFLNICLIDDRHSLFKELEPQRKAVLEVSRLSSGRAAFCTTLSPYDFEDCVQGFFLPLQQSTKLKISLPE